MRLLRLDLEFFRQAATNRASRCSREAFRTARRRYVRFLASRLVSVVTPDYLVRFLRCLGGLDGATCL